MMELIRYIFDDPNTGKLSGRKLLLIISSPLFPLAGICVLFFGYPIEEAMKMWGVLLVLAGVYHYSRKTDPDKRDH